MNNKMKYDKRPSDPERLKPAGKLSRWSKLKEKKRKYERTPPGRGIDGRRYQKGGKKIDKALDAAGMVPAVGSKPDSKSIDYDAVLSALGLIPGIGAAGKVAGKAAKKATGKSSEAVEIKALKKLLKSGKITQKEYDAKIKSMKGFKKSKKQMGGTFNTGQGSFVEPGMEEI